VRHHDAIVGIERHVPSAGQHPEPFDHGVRARGEALRKSLYLGRSAGVSERPVNRNAQILKVHNAILDASTVGGNSTSADAVQPAPGVVDRRRCDAAAKRHDPWQLRRFAP